MAAVVMRQQVFDAAEELVEVERLGKILIGADVEAASAVFGQRAGRKNENRHIAALVSERFANGVTAHAGQHDVQNDQIQIGFVLLEGLKRRGAAVGDGDAVAFIL